MKYEVTVTGMDLAEETLIIEADSEQEARELAYDGVDMESPQNVQSCKELPE